LLRSSDLQDGDRGGHVCRQEKLPSNTPPLNYF